MKSTVGVQVYADTLQRLIAHLSSKGDLPNLAEALSTAIDHWIMVQSGDAGAATLDTGRGYQWKTLFLPEGTLLRSWSYGETRLARVEGDRIIADGRAVTPNQFAQSFARTIRNAWRDLYVKRPGEKHFRPACVLRREVAVQLGAGPVQ